MNIYNSFINEILNDINNGNTQRDYLYYETNWGFKVDILFALIVKWYGINSLTTIYATGVGANGN